MANFEDWNWETIIRDNIGLYLTTATYLASREIEIGEKIRKIRAITLFKVIEVGTNRKPVCDLVINSNWHPISYRLGVIAAVLICTTWTWPVRKRFSKNLVGRGRSKSDCCHSTESVTIVCMVDHRSPSSLLVHAVISTGITSWPSLEGYWKYETDDIAYWWCQWHRRDYVLIACRCLQVPADDGFHRLSANYF